MLHLRIILERKVRKNIKLLSYVAERMADIKTGGLVGGAVSGVIDSTISAVQGVKDPIYTFIGKKIKLPRPFRNQILLSM